MEPVLQTHVALRCAIPTYKTSLQILARCTHRSAEQGPLWGCERVGVRKPAFIPVRRHPATGSHPRARGALYGGGGAPRAVGIRPGKCAQVRLRCSALTFGYAVRLRPVSRRLACGSRRNAPRFMTIDRSLVRPFPHQRIAYRVRGASPLRGAPAPGFTEPCSAVRGRTSLRFAPRLRRISPLLIIQHTRREQ